MIGFLRGRLAAKSASAAVVECGGVGYEVLSPLTTLERLPATGEEVFLLTEMLVRAESQTLYGFLEDRDRDIFRRLIKTGGVGAKTALALMSALSSDELLRALADGDSAVVSRAPGIGAKTAERIIVDFRGSPLLLRTSANALSNADRDVEQALAGLGYKKAEIAKALSALPAAKEEEDTAARLRMALQILSGR